PSVSESPRETGLPHTRTDPVVLRGLRGRHAVFTRAQRGFGRRLNFGGDPFFNGLELRTAHTLREQIRLIQSNRIAPPPRLEQGPSERNARFRFVVRGVTAHAE